MLRSIYLYSLSNTTSVQELITQFQDEFDEIVQQEFSPDELNIYGPQLEELAHVYVQPIFSEISFNDFEIPEEKYLEFKFIFESCRSCVVFENLADFYTNPFQVSYLMEFLRHFDTGLIDLGNFRPLISKHELEADLRLYPNMMKLKTQKIMPKKIQNDEDQQLERDIEFIRSHSNQTAYEFTPKTQYLFNLIRSNSESSETLLRISKLNPKEFNDLIEKIRVVLKNK